MHENEKKVPVILPLKDVSVKRNVMEAGPAMLRIFRDHEDRVCPMFFIDFVAPDVDGRMKRGLIPIVDIDATMVAEAIMRIQGEYEEFAKKWRAQAEKPVPAPAAAGLPPLVFSRR